MNEANINQLLQMFSGVEDKKLLDSVNKAIDILKNQSIDSIKEAIISQDFSNLPGVSNDVSIDVGKLIDSLPEVKKKALVEKFNSPEVQEVLKKDKNKAINMLMKSLI